MRRIIILTLLIAVVLTLSACTGNSIINSLSKAAVIEVNTSQDCQDYVDGEDYQQCWNNFGSSNAMLFTKAEYGYYFYQDRLLYYHDISTGDTVPLCNRPNCDHTRKSCNANLDFLSYIEFFHYYDGNLYIMGTDDGNADDVNIYRISADGSTRGIVGTIFSLEGNTSYSCVIHRGYVYCALSNSSLADSSLSIYRLSLSGDDISEIIYSTEDHIGGGIQLNAYGNYIYIQHTYYADTAGNDYTGDLYQYDIQTGETTLICNDIWRSYAVDSKSLYYDNGSQVIVRNLESGTESVLLDTGMPVYLTFDGAYLYCDNACGLWLNDKGNSERNISVIDTRTSSLCATIPLTNDYSEFIGADAENIIVMIPKTLSNGYYGTIFYYCEQEKVIANEEIFWTESGH